MTGVSVKMKYSIFPMLFRECHRMYRNYNEWQRIYQFNVHRMLLMCGLHNSTDGLKQVSWIFKSELSESLYQDEWLLANLCLHSQMVRACCESRSIFSVWTRYMYLYICMVDKYIPVQWKGSHYVDKCQFYWVQLNQDYRIDKLLHPDKRVGVTTYSCHNSNDSLVISPLKLVNGWEITSH